MTIRDGLTAVCIAAGTLLPAVVLAQLTANPYAGESYEYNSDVFYLPTNGQAPRGKDGPTFADNILRSRVGVDGNYVWGDQKFFATIDGRRYDYDHFTYLDHNEARVNLGLNWVAGSAFDGLVDYRHDRTMVQFTDLIDVTRLILQTEDTALAKVNLEVSPEWRVESQLKDRELYSPRPDAPSLSLHEDSITEGLRYLGVADVAAGFDLGYLKGTFSNAPLSEAPALRYHQVTVDGAATYVLSGVTNFNGNLGYTRRSDDAGNDVSGITGKLAYRRDLTVKTSVGAEFDRGINSYVTTAGSEIDTTLQVFATWMATYKLTVQASYKWTDSKFPNYGIGDRTDHIQDADLEATYQWLRWLSIHPYVRYQTRASTLFDYSYNSTGAGVEVLVTLFKPR